MTQDNNTAQLDSMPVVTIGPFPAGMNNIQGEESLPEGSLRSAINIDIDDSGKIRTRPKFTKVYSGSVSSLYKGYFVEDNVLKYLNSDYTVTVVNSNIRSNNISYTNINNIMYYTDGDHVYSGDHSILGMDSPEGFVVSDNGTGSLSGDYLVSLAFITNGEISAPSEITKVTSTGGISITNIPVVAGSTVLVYASKKDSSDLYLQGKVTTSSINLFSIVNNTHKLPVKNLRKLPGGSILRSHNARLYVAQDNVVYFSEPLRFGLYNPSYNFFQFASDVIIMQPVDNGIYIVADKTYFLSGEDPTKPESLRVVSTETAVQGTGITLDASVFKLEVKGEIAYWFSESGGVIGLHGGQIQEFSKERLSTPERMNKGSTMYTEEDGIHKLVTTIDTNDSGTRTNIGASDSATAQIIRNGVIL